MKTSPLTHPELWNTFLLAGKRSPGICRFPTPPTRDEGWEIQTAKGSTGGHPVKNTQKPIEFDIELVLLENDQVDHVADWDVWKAVLELRPPTPPVVSAAARDQAIKDARAARDAAIANAKNTPAKLRSQGIIDMSTPAAQAEIKKAKVAVEDAERNLRKASGASTTVTNPPFKALDIYHPQLAGLKPPVRSVVVKTWTEPQPDVPGRRIVKIRFIEYAPLAAKGSASPQGSKSSSGGSGSGSQSRNDPNADLKKRVKELTDQYKRTG